MSDNFLSENENKLKLEDDDTLFTIFMKLRFGYKRVFLAESYIAEWKQRFEYNPTAYMDNDSLECYRKAKIIYGNNYF